MYSLIYFIIVIAFVAYKFNLKNSLVIAFIACITCFIFLPSKDFTMIYLIIFLATPINVVLFKKLCEKQLDNSRILFDDRNTELARLIEEEKELIAGKNETEKQFMDIESHYEITKDFSSKLDEEEVKQILINHLIGLKVCNSCLFAHEKKELDGYEQIFGVDFEGENFGFLGVKGLKNRSRFGIVFSQFILALRRAKSYTKIQELSIIDDLTKLYLRRYFLERFNGEFLRSVNNHLNLSFIMIDIDDFKGFNDKFGHLVGDAVLFQVAEIVKQNIREIDLAGRYGGEEFCLVLPETDKMGAFLVAERIRKEVGAKTFKAYDETIKLTVSLGLASYPGDSFRPQELINSADRALYKAKEKGKNLTIAN